MARVSFTELRQNIVTWFDRVSGDRGLPLVIRQGGKKVT